MATEPWLSRYGRRAMASKTENSFKALDFGGFQIAWFGAASKQMHDRLSEFGTHLLIGRSNMFECALKLTLGHRLQPGIRRKRSPILEMTLWCASITPVEAKMRPSLPFQCSSRPPPEPMRRVHSPSYNSRAMRPRLQLWCRLASLRRS